MRSLLAGILVCWSSGCGSPAAPEQTPDAADDAPAAWVRVVDNGAPIAGARVVFHSPSGEAAGRVVTDDEGVAVHPVIDGAAITVAYPNEITLATSRLQLLTVTGVDPGDFVTVEIPSYGGYRAPDLGPVAGRVRLTIPELQGAGTYVVHLGCTDVTTETLTTEIDVPERCLGSDDLIDITVDAFTPFDLPARLGTTFARGVRISDGSTAEVTLPAWIDPYPSLEVQIHDIPAGATNAFAIPLMLVDGQAFAPFSADSTAISGATASLSPGFMSEFADLVDLEVRLNSDLPNITSHYLLGAPPEPTTSVSGAAFLPTIRDVELDSEATQISWTSTGELASADAAFLHVRSSRREGVVTRHRRWTVLTPPTIASPFVLPTLPDELARWRPQPGDDDLDPGMVVFDADWIGGFDAFVADHGTRFLDDACVPTYTTARMTRAGAFWGPRFTTRAY